MDFKIFTADAHAVPFWKMDLDGVPAFDAIWDSVRSQCEALVGGPLRVVRQYANGHTYGQGGSPHVDDYRPGAFTLLYYPMTEWQGHWEGETVFHDASGEVMLAVRPRPNRGVLFDSRIPHAGRAPSRSCPALRVTVAFKLEEVPAAAQRPTESEASPTATGQSPHYTETSRQGAVREYSVRFDDTLVEARVREELESIGKSVRLPGFRADRIPASVLQQRYGSRARAAAIRALMEEVVQSVAPDGALISSVVVTGGTDTGALEGRLTVTFLRDLPDVAFSAMELERLVPDAPDDEAAAEANLHFREQVLDRLATAWDFIVPPALVERDFAAVRKAAETQLDPGEDLTELTAAAAQGRRAPRSHRDRGSGNRAQAGHSHRKRHPARVTWTCPRGNGRQLDHFPGARLRATRERTGAALGDGLDPSGSSRTGPPWDHGRVVLLPLLSSFAVVALAEMGDKTQLIALVLGLRYRRPWTVMLGILLATVFNHALAATVGVWSAAWLGRDTLAWIVGLGFLGFGVWTLVPDRAEAPAESSRWGPLLTTAVVFFFAEMGDKTQLATVALGARFGSAIQVTAGTTLGMLAADGVAVAAGARFADRVPLRLFRRLAAALFFAFGAASIAAGAGWW